MFRQISTRKTDISGQFEKYFCEMDHIRPKKMDDMGGLSEMSDFVYMLHHTNKNYINILEILNCSQL